MSRAFIREPDETGDSRCPVCDAQGVLVNAETLDSHIKPEARGKVASSAYFCPTDTCDVAYFDIFQRRVDSDDLSHPVYPKDPQAPICPCFGLTKADIEKDIAEGGVTRMRDVVLKARTPEARCSTLAADGQCCVPLIQHVYHKLKEPAES